MSRRAFTLIELMVIIAVLALVATIAVPSVVAMEKSQRERSTLEAIRRLPFAARLKARQDSKTVTLRYESGRNEIGLTEGDDTDATQAVALTEGVQVSSVDLDDAGKGSADEVKFYEDGTADAATLRIQAGNLERYLRIEKNSTATWTDTAPQPKDERWEAGEIEQRVGG